MKNPVRWVLFEYVEREPKLLSKHFKTKKKAVKARSQLPEKTARRIAIGTLRTPVVR
jgi:hypothetical protein